MIAAEEIARPLVEKLAERAPLALQAAKSALVTGAEGALALDLERAGFEALLDTTDKYAGQVAVKLTPGERENPQIPGWNYSIPRNVAIKQSFVVSIIGSCVFFRLSLTFAENFDFVLRRD